MRDRITDLRRVPARELRANPANWRSHPPEQRTALTGMLDRIGVIGAVIARETADGLELIDGHLRADIAGDETLPGPRRRPSTTPRPPPPWRPTTPSPPSPSADIDRLRDLVDQLDAPPMDYSALYGTLDPVELIEVADPPEAARDNKQPPELQAAPHRGLPLDPRRRHPSRRRRRRMARRRPRSDTRSSSRGAAPVLVRWLVC